MEVRAGVRPRNVAILLCLTLTAGCGSWNSTDIDYVNLSIERVYATITGVTPNVSPGALLPGTGTEELKRKTAHLGGSIAFDDAISISWTVHGTSTRREVLLNRKDFGIPREVRGGKVRITYTAARTWELKYSR